MRFTFPERANDLLSLDPSPPQEERERTKKSPPPYLGAYERRPLPIMVLLLLCVLFCHAAEVTVTDPAALKKERRATAEP
jgi:hypothetical protein